MGYETASEGQSFTSMPYQYVLEAALLSLMLTTLMIPPILAPIIPWLDLPPLILLRASTWLVGICVLPGLLLLRVASIDGKIPRLAVAALSIHLSLVLIGLGTLGTYYAGNMQILPKLFLGPLIVASGIFWFKHHRHRPLSAPKLSKWQILLILTTISSVLLSMYIHLSLRYLIPGDIWVSVQPSVEILSSKNVYESFRYAEYPLMFGFILAGLSIVTGLPLVNAHVLLFPLVSLNIVTFFVLIRNGLNVSEGTAVVASIVYGFSGGLGWLVQTVVYHGQLDFWTLSFLTQDIYFSVSFWNNIAFSYKSLSLTLAYASIAALMLSMRFHETRRKIFTIAFSSVFMLFSFYIHMLEAFVFVPILLAVPLLYQKGRIRYTTLSLLVLFSTIMSALVEFLMSNYYSWLAALKVGLLLSTVSFDKSTFPWVVPVVILAVVSIILSAKFVLPGRANLGLFLENFFHRFKVPIVMIVATPYLVGILLWQNAPNPSLDVSFPFPWYLNVTRYGLVGILALMGVLTVSRGERWFVLASLWCMVTLLFGGLWWGSRVNGYIFPMLALFAGLGITRTWEQRGTFSRTNAIYLRNLVSKSKPAFAIVVSGILLLSFTSVFYGANYYSSRSSPSDDEVRALLWIYENTPQDATVLVPNIYTISKGVETISDRRVYESSTLPVVMNANSFTDLVHLLNRQSSTYVVVREGTGVRSSLMDQVVAFSSPMFESGSVKVYRLPSWNPPSENYTLAVLDRQGSSSFMKYAFGWIDNDLTDGWSYKNVNVSTDGRVLALKWDFGEGMLEPSMRKEIPLIDTERYPYFIIKYRNTAETSGTAIENIGQIVTLLDKGGYPAGFLQNIYLPINLEQDFRVFVTRLPANQSVASVGLWMRNYEQLNGGSIGLEIDFVGFSSEPLVDMRFLSMAIPALWPEQYAVSSEHDKLAHADTLVSAYDEDAVSAFEHGTNIKTLVLLNATASVPSWGQNWTKSDGTFVSGYLHEKRVIIVGMDTLIRNKDISRFAREVFERIR